MGDSEQALSRNIAGLQAESVTVLASLTGLVAYVWFLALCWPSEGSAAPLSAWIGSVVLAVASTTSLWLRQRQPLAAAVVLVTASLCSVCGVMLATHRPEMAHLFLVPVIFASVLLGQSAVSATVGIACLSAGLIGVRVLGLHVTSFEIGFPIIVLIAISISMWLASRNLYTALTWAFNGYEFAHANERLAQERQAELRSALKSLDEATYRLERASNVLELARDQAEEARRHKQQFAQTISHELRTPLNLVVSFADLMAQAPEFYGQPLPPAYARDLGIIYRNARHLQSLVNDVLDLARIDAAQMSIVPGDADPASLVQESVNAVRSLVESRGLTLQTDIEPNLPLLWVDAGRIRQVLINLLTNAARFTMHGSVHVKAFRHGDEVRFSVADTGVGIAPEQIPHVFEEFGMVDGSATRRQGGAGLGLAISERFVRLHTGRIWVESALARGSTFTFSLPCGRRDPLSDPVAYSLLSADATTHDSQQDDAVLLAVTRSPAAATLLTRYLRGWRTVVVADLAQAQEVARRLLPQGILVDTSSETVTPESLASYAQSWGVPATPFLACPLPGEEPARIRLAVDGYLVKPISRESLWEALRQFGDEVDKILVVDDDHDFVRLLGRLLDSPVRRYQVVKAYDARECLEMAIRHRPDLVLLDLALPDAAGMQVIAALRGRFEASQMRIVVVSAQDQVDGLRSLPGALLMIKADGFMSGQLVEWIQNSLAASTRAFSALQVRAAHEHGVHEDREAEMEI